jgi:7,8-dihydro-6-hydroxymethylpterin dimethyltransferase
LTIGLKRHDLPIAASEYMSDDDIRAARPKTKAVRDALGSAGAQMRASGQWDASQFMGRRWPIGCVALEITQRCNLDCTACYLSEHAEAVKDVPLAELFRRIDMIFEHYGAGTGVQVTGGDPTLRKKDELIQIVGRIAAKGMRPALFTNGIRAKRELLKELADAGLVDVAFHVDMTQERRGFESEASLNAIRQDYIERARGLPIAVMFNTTVTDQNVDQIPEVAAFFVRNSDVVRLASFQLQADTGRGTLSRRSDSLTMKSLQSQIESGASTSISFNTAHIGHSRCNRYAMTFVTNGQAYNALDDVGLFQSALAGTARRSFDRRNKANAVRSFLIGLLARPSLWRGVVAWIARKLWLAKHDLIASRGRVHKLSFFIHNFMDACSLEKQRIDACSFMVATQAGPISMCLHNAKRDAFILAPIRLNGADRDKYWNPLTGEIANNDGQSVRPEIPSKKRKHGAHSLAGTK